MASLSWMSSPLKGSPDIPRKNAPPAYSVAVPSQASLRNCFTIPQETYCCL